MSYSKVLDNSPGHEPADGRLHRLVSSVSIHEFGRRWLGDTLDQAALLAKTATHDADIGDEPATPSGHHKRVGVSFTGGPLMRARRTWVMGFME